MAATAASVGEQSHNSEDHSDARVKIFESLLGLAVWLEASGYEGYDTFDGLNARFVRPLTFETKALRTLLQQGVRRFPINLRPLLGVQKSRSTKGMGFLARGFISLYRATGDVAWQRKAESMLQWLVESRSPGYSGACWGNHFDYQSRSIYVGKLTPSVVWTSHIGHAFLEAYEVLGERIYLDIAVSSCEHILRDLGAHVEGDTVCINYFPISTHQVHNANSLGASLLARTYYHTRHDSYRSVAEKAMQYTAKHQRVNSSWYYGEEANLRWVDNFHTAYVLDCFKHYSDRIGDLSFDNQMMNGYRYWKSTFFLPDGAPRYYDHKTLPLDIQCSSQAIDTLVFFRDRDPDSLLLALKVAQWAIDNMQDPSGYFYYRRYSSRIVNKTPTLHWGQATMLCALARLYEALGRWQLTSGIVSESNARGLAHETH